MVIVLFVFCGLITGLLSGMLGIGGGVITVPVLYFLFHSTGLFEHHTMQVAASTSLAISFMISLFSSIVQHSKRAILFSAFRLIAPGLVIGCICGVLLAQVVSSQLIRFVFGIGAFLMGVYFAIPKLPHFKIDSSPSRSLSFFGLMIGVLSSLLGIGGGVLAFPTFLGYGMDAKTSSATSSCTTTVSTFIGTITYLFIAWKNPKLTGTFGYVDIDAFIAIGIAALFSVCFGVKLSHAFDIYLIKQIFGICLSLVGVTMLLL